MKRVLRKYGITSNKKVPVFFIAIALTLFYVFSVEPVSFLQIGTFAILLATTFFAGLCVVFPKNIAVLISFFVFFFVLFKALQILDYLTIAILSAFIISLAIYLKQK